MSTFSKSEKKRIARVLEAQRRVVDMNLSDNGYANDHGGCPNCGDTGGVFTILYELEQAFGIRRADGTLNKSVMPSRKSVL
jgi:hypothetical protein